MPLRELHGWRLAVLEEDRSATTPAVHSSREPERTVGSSVDQAIERGAHVGGLAIAGFLALPGHQAFGVLQGIDEPQDKPWPLVRPLETTVRGVRDWIRNI